MTSKNYLLMSFRSKRLIEFPRLFGRNIGECTYVGAFSNFKWPDGVTYPEVREVAWNFSKNHNSRVQDQYV